MKSNTHHVSASAVETIGLQAREHPLVFTDTFGSLEEYCLFLMHLRAYEEAARRSDGVSVLDLGCNNGYGTHLLADSASSVIGCDVSESALADARKRYPELDFRQVDGVTLPFANSQFDLVTSFQVIEHVPDTAAYIAEIRRVLKSPGMAIFTTPNAAIRLDPGMPPWNRFHVREYRADELVIPLRNAFDDVRILGLFAADELYQVEYQRCQKALLRNRNPSNPSRPSTLSANMASFAKSILPLSAVNALRRLKRHHPRIERADSPLDARVQSRFSTKDMHYAETDLDSALDLMAICTKG
jgi:SAM-dependent methyltransferase